MFNNGIEMIVMSTPCCNDDIHHIGDGCLFLCIGIGPKKKGEEESYWNQGEEEKNLQ